MLYLQYAMLYLSPKKTGLLMPSITKWVVSPLQGFPVCVLKILAILTVCCWIVSSAPSKDSTGWLKQAEVLMAEVQAGEHSFQFECREYLWCWNTLPWLTKTTLPLSICAKSQLAVFYLRMEVGKRCFWWKRCLWDLWKSPIILQIN